MTHTYLYHGITYAGIPSVKPAKAAIKPTKTPHEQFYKTHWALLSALTELKQKMAREEYKCALDAISSGTVIQTCWIVELKRDISIINLLEENLSQSAQQLIGKPNVAKLSEQAKNPTLAWPTAYQNELDQITRTHQPKINKKIENNNTVLASYEKFSFRHTSNSQYAGLFALFSLPFAATISATAAIVVASLAGGLLIGIPVLLGLSYLAVKTYTACSNAYAKNQLSTAKQTQINGWIYNQADRTKIRFFKAQQAYQDESLQPLQKLPAV